MGAKGNGNNVWIGLSFSNRIVVLFQLAVLHFHFIGKVTSLVAKKDQILATRIEEAIRKNESLESVSVDSVKRDVARSRIKEQKEKNVKLLKVSRLKNKAKATTTATSSSKSSSAAEGKSKTPKKISGNGTKSVQKTFKTKVSKKPYGVASSSKGKTSGWKPQAKNKSSASKSAPKLSVVGFRGRSSLSNKSGNMKFK